VFHANSLIPGKSGPARRLHTLAYMRIGIVLWGASALCLLACGGAIDRENAREDAIGGRWSPLMTCNDGAAILEASSDERVQLVVREENAVKFLSARVKRAENFRGEVIVSGAIPAERVANLRHFIDDSGRFEVAASEPSVEKSARVVAEVSREVDDRVRVSFQEITTTRTCTGDLEQRFFRNGLMVEKEEAREVASWEFTGCR
jgi:hypothetical protein